MPRTPGLRGWYAERLIKSYVDEAWGDRRVRLVLLQIRTRNYFRNLIRISKWLWRCFLYVTVKPPTKIVDWCRKLLYYNVVTKTEDDDSRIYKVLDGGSSQGGQIEPPNSD